MSKTRHMPVAPTETRFLSAGDEVTPHCHDDHQLIYASSGVLELIVPDGTWYTPSVRAVWVPGGTVHHWQVHGATTVHLIGIPVATASPVEHRPSLVLVTPLFRELIIACSAGGTATTPAARRLQRVLVDQIQPFPGVPTMLPLLRDARLVDLQTILEADMTASPTLGELGRRIGASERTLSRLFHDSLGMSFTVWRNHLRLHLATLMLAEGKTVTYAAGNCGYSSASAFITTFRSAFGQTPGSLYR